MKKDEIKKLIEWIETIETVYPKLVTIDLSNAHFDKLIQILRITVPDLLENSSFLFRPKVTQMRKSVDFLNTTNLVFVTLESMLRILVNTNLDDFMLEVDLETVDRLHYLVSEDFCFVCCARFEEN